LGEGPLINLKCENKTDEQFTAEILINHSGGTMIVTTARTLEIVGRATIVGWGFWRPGDVANMILIGLQVDN
jgi:hypothetical protein